MFAFEHLKKSKSKRSDSVRCVEPRPSSPSRELLCKRLYHGWFLRDTQARRAHCGRLGEADPIQDSYFASGCITVSTPDQKAMIATRKGKLK